MFAGRVFADPENARQEAVRGTFDPRYLFYSIGKLMMMKLRENCMTLYPQKFSPLTFVRHAMLGDADHGRLLQ